MPKKENPEKETLNRLSRKTKTNMIKSSMSFEKQLEKIDNEIALLSKRQLKDFDEKTDLYSKYLSIGKTDDTVEKLREKLRKI